MSDRRVLACARARPLAEAGMMGGGMVGAMREPLGPVSVLRLEREVVLARQLRLFLSVLSSAAPKRPVFSNLDRLMFI